MRVSAYYLIKISSKQELQISNYRQTHTRLLKANIHRFCYKNSEPAFEEQV